MYCALAVAESGDPNASNLPIVLGGIFILAVIAFLAFVLIFISRSRGHRQTELITTATFFWAIIAAGSLIYAGQAQMNWSKEYMLRLQTGYLDPTDTSDAPRLPWVIWSGLGVAYGAMLIWSLSKKGASPKKEPPFTP
jgi:hypothetical protein